jgi:hypothetical protein
MEGSLISLGQREMYDTSYPSVIARWRLFRPEVASRDCSDSPKVIRYPPMNRLASDQRNELPESKPRILISLYHAFETSTRIPPAPDKGKKPGFFKGPGNVAQIA